MGEAVCAIWVKRGLFWRVRARSPRRCPPSVCQAALGLNASVSKRAFTPSSPPRLPTQYLSPQDVDRVLVGAAEATGEGQRRRLQVLLARLEMPDYSAAF